jgi:hypothetical protein
MSERQREKVKRSDVRGGQKNPEEEEGRAT